MKRVSLSHWFPQNVLFFFLCLTSSLISISCSPDQTRTLSVTNTVNTTTKHYNVNEMKTISYYSSLTVCRCLLVFIVTADVPCRYKWCATCMVQIGRDVKFLSFHFVSCGLGDCWLTHNYSCLKLPASLTLFLLTLKHTYTHSLFCMFITSQVVFLYLNVVSCPRLSFLLHSHCLCLFVTWWCVEDGYRMCQEEMPPSPKQANFPLLNVSVSDI